MAKTLLNDAIEEYRLRRVAERKAKGTLNMDATALRRLMEVTGNIHVEKITGKHISELMIRLAQKNSNRTLCNYHFIYEAFFAYCAKSGKMPRYHDPMEDRKPPSFTVEERRRIPVDYFPAFLNHSRNDRERMLFASALYLLPRIGEIRQIRLEDINLTERRIRVNVEKQRGRKKPSTDLMPITRELDEELRRWLPIYSDTCGRLQNNWYLIPNPGKTTFHRPEGTGSGRFQSHHQDVAPLQTLGARPHVWAQEVMEKIGFATRNPDGTSRNEGMHTLRRSGARARFDALRDLGYDGALRQVQALLHHANSSMTEHYIGMDVDKLRRDEALMGEWMYPQLQGDENQARLKGLQLLTLEPDQKWESDVLDLVA